MQFSDIELAAKNLTVTLLPHTGSNTRTTTWALSPSTESVLAGLSWPQTSLQSTSVLVCFHFCWCHLDIVRKKSTCLSFCGSLILNKDWSFHDVASWEMIHMQNAWWCKKKQNKKTPYGLNRRLNVLKGSQNIHNQQRQKRQTCRIMGETGFGLGSKKENMR